MYSIHGSRQTCEMNCLSESILLGSQSFSVALDYWMIGAIFEPKAPADLVHKLISDAEIKLVCLLKKLIESRFDSKFTWPVTNVDRFCFILIFALFCFVLFPRGSVFILTNKIDRSKLKRFISKVTRPKHQANVLKRLVSLKVMQIQMHQPPFYLPAKVRIFWVIRFHPSHRLFSRLRNHSTVSLTILLGD